MTKVAVVILNWNGEKLLPQFLPSVIEHSNIEGVEVIVADNASEDASIKIMQEQFPQIRIIELEKNYGFARGYNEALKQVEAEYYLLLNSDVEISEGWLSPLIDLMDRDKSVAACGPKILDYKKKTHFEYAGAVGGFIDKYGFPFCRGRIFTSVEEDLGQYDDIREVFWVSGCAMMVRADKYWELDGFDNDFFAHMEEIDFCWRLKLRGNKVVNVPESVIYHVGGASLEVGSPHKTYLNFRNSLLTIYKNTIDEKELRKILRRRRRLDSIASYKFLLFDSIAHYDAVNQAHIDFQNMLPKFKLKRKKNIENAVLNCPHILKTSLVTSYYLRCKKSFVDYNI